MRYLVLVSDYDGTIATEGRAEAAALKAIERLRLEQPEPLMLASLTI